MQRITLLLSLTCALLATSLVGELNAQNLKKPTKETQVDKLLVIVLVRNIENRRTLERELAYDFKDYGVVTVLSHTTRLAGAEHITKEDAKAVCQEHGADGVLVVKLVDMEKQNAYSYNQKEQYTGAGTPSATSSGVVFTNRGTYSWGTYAYGNYFDAVSSNIVEIQSDLYDVGSEQMLFQDDYKFRVGEIEAAIGKFSGKLTKRVVKSKHLATAGKKAKN
ncbi:hypothetical protein [Reichenbachiella ulvae]|uniref:Uncharacterized protein n=1 Tax=Reichenbachiella ulvae TaxID=2980104 RepID=A0ABT3CN50_9BACT|nr:hypothetical protein [Reichenbachiella ulvae]MCV9385160.1 hypothetical protein [Reichenbachiella ulvae]